MKWTPVACVVIRGTFTRAMSVRHSLATWHVACVIHAPLSPAPWNWKRNQCVIWGNNIACNIRQRRSIYKVSNTYMVSALFLRTGLEIRNELFSESMFGDILRLEMVSTWRFYRGLPSYSSIFLGITFFLISEPFIWEKEKYTCGGHIFVQNFLHFFC